MPARTLQGDLTCFAPAFVDFDLGNVFGSNPDYDEAVGPHILGEGFVPIDEVAEEQGEGCEAVRQIEDPTDRFNRLFTASLDDPLAKGETEADVLRALEDHSPVNRALFGYGLAKREVVPDTSALYFEDDEFQKVKPGVLLADRRKFDRKIKRMVPVKRPVTVVVRKRRCIQK